MRALILATLATTALGCVQAADAQSVRLIASRERSPCPMADGIS